MFIVNFDVLVDIKWTLCVSQQASNNKIDGDGIQNLTLVKSLHYVRMINPKLLKNLTLHFGVTDILA